jgi:hypothetical protein
MSRSHNGPINPRSDSVQLAEAQIKEPKHLAKSASQRRIVRMAGADCPWGGGGPSPRTWWIVQNFSQNLQYLTTKIGSSDGSLWTVRALHVDCPTTPCNKNPRPKRIELWARKNKWQTRRTGHLADGPRWPRGRSARCESTQLEKQPQTSDQWISQTTWSLETKIWGDEHPKGRYALKIPTFNSLQLPESRISWLNLKNSGSTKNHQIGELSTGFEWQSSLYWRDAIDRSNFSPETNIFMQLSVVCIGEMWLTHLLFFIAFITVIFFLFTLWNRVSAKFLGACLLIRLECQNLALSPFPTVTIVEASKISQPVLSHGISSPVNGRSAFCQLNQSQPGVRSVCVLPTKKSQCKSSRKSV